LLSVGVLVSVLDDVVVPLAVAETVAVRVAEPAGVGLALGVGVAEPATQRSRQPDEPGINGNPALPFK